MPQSLAKINLNCSNQWNIYRRINERKKNYSIGMGLFSESIARAFLQIGQL